MRAWSPKEHFPVGKSGLGKFATRYEFARARMGLPVAGPFINGNHVTTSSQLPVAKLSMEMAPSGQASRMRWSLVTSWAPRLVAATTNWAS